MQQATQGALGALKNKMASLKNENDLLRDENDMSKREVDKWKDEVSRVGVAFLHFYQLAFACHHHFRHCVVCSIISVY